MCVHPSAPPGFDFKHVHGRFICMSLNCMYVNVQHGIQSDSL